MGVKSVINSLITTRRDYPPWNVRCGYSGYSASVTPPHQLNNLLSISVTLCGTYYGSRENYNHGYR